jgi:hypothetical protein
VIRADTRRAVLLPRTGFRRVFPGQWAGVSLPVSQQRVLEGIESVLEGGEPRLRSMFAIFTRLTRDDGAPRTEALLADKLLRRAWPTSGLTATARVVIAVPLILGLLALCIFMAVNNSAGPSCRPGPGMTWATGCQSAQQLPDGRM